VRDHLETTRPSAGYTNEQVGGERGVDDNRSGVSHELWIHPRPIERVEGL
jgi:hypothetical protein